MTDRIKIAVGMALGLVWAVLVVWIGTTLDIPPFSRVLVAPFFFLAPGLVLLVMIGSVAARRFFDEEARGGGAFAAGSPAEIDQRVLRNTIEQIAVALCLWLPISILLPEDGLGVVMALSVNFAMARLIFWLGYRIAPPLRAFGFAATFYPTLVALIWAGLWWSST